METLKEKTYVYVDGFNLYYGALNKNTPGYKWLDLNAWLSDLLAHNEIIKIKYFTAQVSGKYGQDKPHNQQLYWRALKTLTNIELIEGHFLFSSKKIHITPDISLLAKVPEEKGTDVNIAAHLIHDAHCKKFETAILISNDSDLAESVRIVTQEIGIKVGVVNPYPVFNKQITRYASFKIQVRDGPLLNSQFPASMQDSAGTITKPQIW